MSAPKKLRIILLPVGKTDRKELERIENDMYSSELKLRTHLSQLFDCGTINYKVLTADEFKKELVFTAIYKPFQKAISNIRKRKQCYDLSEFMDDFNNQEFGEETDAYWMGYVRVR